MDSCQSLTKVIFFLHEISAPPIEPHFGHLSPIIEYFHKFLSLDSNSGLAVQALVPPYSPLSRAQIHSMISRFSVYPP